MRIPLKFVAGQLILNSVVTSPAYRIGFKKIIFVIDTGSSRSFFSEGEAFKFSLPINSLPKLENMRMGGSPYELFKTKGFTFHFKIEDNKTYSLKLDYFAVSKTTRKTGKAQTESQNFPSIIGTDFFVQNNMALHFNPNNESDNYIEIIQK